MTQELKAQLSTGIKAVFAKYGLKGTIAVSNHSTLVVNIKSGLLDFCFDYFNKINERSLVTQGLDKINPLSDIPSYVAPNEYWLSDQFTGDCLACMEELKAAMMQGNHDNSDVMTDFFDVGWYIDINIGQYDKPYECTKIQREKYLADKKALEQWQIDHENSVITEVSSLCENGKLPNGYDFYYSHDQKKWRVFCPDTYKGADIPDNTENLASVIIQTAIDMHDAEKVLADSDQKHKYASMIGRHDYWTLIHATAAQRAEAFLKTLGLWRDDS